MKFASMALKIVSFILLAILFALFLFYADGFGYDGNMADLAMSNVLITAMVLVLIISAVVSVLFDFYERNKYQNEQIYQNLSEKISKLENIAPQLSEIATANVEKFAEIAKTMNERIDENNVKISEYMTQFANLSVQVFAKDKSFENMKHNEVEDAKNKTNSGGDYFNHYTEKTENTENLSSETVDKFENSEKNIIPEDLHNDEQYAQVQAENQHQLSTIFNDDLAQTLSELEIMNDDSNSTNSQDVDLSAYFSDEEKITL